MIDIGEQLRRVAKKKEVEVEQLTRGIFLEAVGNIIAKTPVADEDGGFARGSWVASINSPSSELPERKDKSDKGEDTAEAEKAKISDFDVGDSLFLVSNAPYMEKLEYGGYSQGPNSTEKTNSRGYSIQAPVGMVRLEQRKILRKLKKS